MCQTGQPDVSDFIFCVNDFDIHGDEADRARAPQQLMLNDIEALKKGKAKGFQS
jgi:hypothetical protein